MGVGGLGWLDQKNFFSFKHCSPFLTFTQSFIQIGPKLAKLVLWGGSGGMRVGVRLGGFGWSDQDNFSGFELCFPFLTYTPSFIQIGPKLAKLALWSGLGGRG